MLQRVVFAAAALTIRPFDAFCFQICCPFTWFLRHPREPGACSCIGNAQFFQLAALHFDRQTDAGFIADAAAIFRVLRVQKHHFDELKNAFESTELLINWQCRQKVY